MASPDKIKIWFPHLGSTWLSIRFLLRPSAAIILGIAILYLLLHFFNRLRVSSTNNKDQILNALRYCISDLRKTILFTSYTIGAIVLFFIVLNLLSLLFLHEDDKFQDYSTQLHKVINPKAYHPPHPALNLDKAYMEENIVDNIRYTYLSSREFDYYPRLEEVHSSPYQSKHLNIQKGNADLPNRVTLAAECLSKKTIFCFGGSTTFGTLISDEHTFPSLLMKQYMDNGYCIIVKNYAVCGYNANQETAEFLELLRLGHRPSLAIFMDGLNVGPPYDGSEYTLDMADRFENHPNNDYVRLIYNLPLFKLIMPEKSIEESKTEPLQLILAYDSMFNQKYANKLIENAVLREAIGKLYHVKVLTFLQPNVFYNYDTRQYQSELFEKSFKENYFHNYSEIYKQVQESDKLVDLSNLLTEYGQPAIVDLLHYSPDFNKFLARKVSGYYNPDSLKDYEFIEKAASGIPFDKKMLNN
jgi:hypothetical protein